MRQYGFAIKVLITTENKQMARDQIRNSLKNKNVKYKVEDLGEFVFANEYVRPKKNMEEKQ